VMIVTDDFPYIFPVQSRATCQPFNQSKHGCS
jgi:hypothetical protein